MADFNHLSETGEASMVDVSGKAATIRIATVSGTVRVSQLCAEKLNAEVVKEICSTARIAGISAAKQTAHLIPMCHPIPLSKVTVGIELDHATFNISVTTKTTANTGVEMEALCAAAVTGATIYDMIKAVDPAAVVGPFLLQEKHGGKNGLWTRNQTN